MLIEELKALGNIRIRSLKSITASEWRKTILGLAGIALTMWTFFFVVPITVVEDVSMLPTVTPGSLTWIWPTSKLWPPKRGELVITGLPDSVIRYLNTSTKYRAKHKDHPPMITLLKRVIAIPGDKVTWQGKELVLEADQYWVEGDNKGKSIDSRAKFFGPIPKKDILARAYVIWKSGDKSHD
jgi:type IV secretory pathway protease TraF